ncbi:LysR family transcriptional regulator [Paraburkholderia phenoliruptrix]|uniref:Transcriptional regulator, LysR family n=2 Tax=Paraburkholderia phenoliruptrix TaxID=252970 RepID=K0DZK1_9BURK|nr:LysR substrate-binding domain-containing protein [Paraburkholderia phenoliruptrix]AFT90300.1 transcriptional regulator, LysR family [Paraburkholderia phenoliruptrix BR3459a]CAB4051719.1 HTH-type transcriptional regulator DmlR [Paraburkholderia phenoliruptrix]
MDKGSELYVFTAVVAHGNFVSAAEKCRLTPSGVSRVISRMEDRMGAKLFVRSTRRLSLTAQGEFFYSKIKSMVEQIEAAEAATAQRPQVPHGVLRIRAAAGFVDRQLVPLMPEFLGRYPDLQVEIVVGDVPIEPDDRSVDLAFRSGLAPSEDHLSIRLADNPLVICASPGYLEKNGRPDRPENLGRHNCLTMDGRGVTQAEWMFREEQRRFSVWVKGNLGSVATAIHSAALNGVGIARVPQFLAEQDIREGRLVKLLADYAPDDGRSIYLVYMTTDNRSLKCRALVDYLLEKFNPVPPWMR